jgi:hypothetical protein
LISIRNPSRSRAMSTSIARFGRTGRSSKLP